MAIMRTWRWPLKRAECLAISFWITSKINTKAVSTRKAADESIRATVKELGVDYVDLMLIHGLWTISADEAVEVWKGLLDAKKDGRVRHIGVSNMERPQLEKLIAATGVKPSALQLEYHPYVDPAVHELVAWAKQQGMAITAYGSLGGARNKARVSGEVAKVAQAAAHGISSATLLLRWALERGCAVIPGATTAEHIRDNWNVLSVKVTGDELQRAFGGSAARPKTFAAWTNLPSELERRKKKESGEGGWGSKKQMHFCKIMPCPLSRETLCSHPPTTIIPVLYTCRPSLPHSHLRPRNARTCAPLTTQRARPPSSVSRFAVIVSCWRLCTMPTRS